MCLINQFYDPHRKRFTSHLQFLSKNLDFHFSKFEYTENILHILYNSHNSYKRFSLGQAFETIQRSPKKQSTQGFFSDKVGDLSKEKPHDKDSPERSCIQPKYLSIDKYTS